MGIGRRPQATWLYSGDFKTFVETNSRYVPVGVFRRTHWRLGDCVRFLCGALYFQPCECWFRMCLAVVFAFFPLT